MDLRKLPEGLDAGARVSMRRSIIEKELGVDLDYLAVDSRQIGSADEQSCEQMFGAIPVPVGMAGPLKIRFSSSETKDVYLPLATTEAALVASVNRGCKAVSEAGGVTITSQYIGITRSVAFDIKDAADSAARIRATESEWKQVAEATSSHLKVLSYDIDDKDGVLFLTLAADTDEAMGMNMLTIAAQAVGEYISQQLGIRFITVAANVDSDKKPSLRTKTKGRGYRVKAEAVFSDDVLRDVLKTDPAALLETARAKLDIGSELAGALGKNLHTANIIAALYLATGQDIAHTVEGSLADTTVVRIPEGIRVIVELPAVLVGVRGGGTGLPAQKQSLDMLLKSKTSLRLTTQLAETVAAAALAGEISLLAALSTNTLARAHLALSRK